MHRKLRLYFSICCAVACAAASPIRAQENAQASAYLEQAAAGMLQRTAGNPPFHLTATFTLVKPIVLKDGSALDAQGKYEETWLALDNWRKDVTIGPNYHLVLIRKGDEMWRSGESIEEVSRVLAAIIPDVAIPPQYALMEKFQSGHPGTESKWDVQTVKLGTIDVIRVGLASAKVQQGRRSMLDDAFYFDPSTKALIMRSEAPTAYEYTTGGKLDGRFVPLDGNVEEMNRLIASFHISSLKANPRVDAATFVPGPEFTKSPAGGISLARKISGDAPIYPAIARSAHVMGKVTVSAMIEPDGTTSDLAVVSGPPLLAEAALKAVKTWRFVPAVINGVPTATRMQFVLNFEFGKVNY
jgi:TonB family protein